MFAKKKRTVAEVVKPLKIMITDLESVISQNDAEVEVYYKDLDRIEGLITDCKNESASAKSIAEKIKSLVG